MCRDLKKRVQYSLPICPIKEVHLKKNTGGQDFSRLTYEFLSKTKKKWLYVPHFLYLPNFSKEYVSLSCKITGALATGNELSVRCTYEVD